MNNAVFKILGWLSIIGGIFSIIQSGMAVFVFWAGYKYLTPELLGSISLPFQIAFLGIPIILSILYFTEGIGFLRLKHWLPNLLLTTLVLAILLQVMAYFDSVSYLIDPVQALVEYFIKGGIPLFIGAIVVWYTFKNKRIFIN